MFFLWDLLKTLLAHQETLLDPQYNNTPKSDQQNTPNNHHIYGIPTSYPKLLNAKIIISMGKKPISKNPKTLLKRQNHHIYGKKPISKETPRSF